MRPQPIKIDGRQVQKGFQIKPITSQEKTTGQTSQPDKGQISQRLLRKFSSTDRKKLIFYPQSFKKSDELLTEFRITNSGNPSLSQERLDPEEMGFAQPDFGFESNLNFAQNASTKGWQRFLDCISIFPKHE